MSSVAGQQDINPPSDPDRIMREILDSRARQLAKSYAEEPLASEFVEVLKFSVGRDRFAIETRYVTEVLHDMPVTPLPGDTNPLLGLANLRGEVLAVMTLWGVLPLGTEIAAAESGQWIIVLGLEQAMFGIAVTEVTEVVAFPIDQILSAPAAANAAVNLCRGVTADAEVVLDGQAVLEDSQFVIDQHE